MRVTHAQVGNVLYPLTEGQPLPIKVGQTLRVFYAFRYKLPDNAGVRIWASLYTKTPIIGTINREEKAQNKQTITLAKALDWRDYEGEIDIEVGQIGSGIYGLICELPDYPDAEHHIDDCIEVTEAPSVWGMIGPLLVLGLMAGMVSMMAPMMEEGAS